MMPGINGFIIFQLIGIIAFTLFSPAYASEEDNIDFELSRLESIYKEHKKFPNTSVPILLPNIEKRHTSLELANLLDPYLLNLNSSLVSIADLSMLSERDQTPDMRSIDFWLDDMLNQLGLQLLIDYNLITPNSLILSDTGHDIPMAHQLLLNTQFNAQVVFHLPETLIIDEADSNSAIYKRLSQQAQTWIPKIARIMAGQSNQPDTLFIGLEAHREDYDGTFLYTINTKNLPTREQLKSLNIHKLIYIYERNPGDSHEVRNLVLADLEEYFEKINLPVIFLGADCRRASGCEF